MKVKRPFRDRFTERMTFPPQLVAHASICHSDHSPACPGGWTSVFYLFGVQLLTMKTGGGAGQVYQEIFKHLILCHVFLPCGSLSVHFLILYISSTPHNSANRSRGKPGTASEGGTKRSRKSKNGARHFVGLNAIAAAASRGQ